MALMRLCFRHCTKLFLLCLCLVLILSLVDQKTSGKDKRDSKVLSWVTQRVDLTFWTDGYVADQEVSGAAVKSETTKRWIVSNGQNNDIKFSFDDIRTWGAVIPAKNRNAFNGCQRCLFVDNHNPEKSYMTKALLGAVKKGAQYLYIMTSSHDVKRALERMTSYSKQGLAYSGNQIFKPCSHFIQPLFGTNRTFGQCFDRNWVYSYTVSDFPVRHLTSFCEDCGKESKLFQKGKVYCSPQTPNVHVSPGTYSKFTFRNTLWAYDSFWALFIYMLHEQEKITERKSLLLSYIVQRLLWEMKTTVGFVSSFGLNKQSFGRDDTKDKIQEDAIIDKVCRFTKEDETTSKLIKYLNSWACSPELDIIHCTKLLFHNLLEHSFVSKNEVSIVEDYISALTSTRYTPPPRTSKQKLLISSFVGSKSKRVLFWPASLYRMWTEDPFQKLCDRFERQKILLKRSTDRGSEQILRQLPRYGLEVFKEPPLSSIVLVIVFKNNDASTHIQMAQFFDFMYGRHFRHIVYCGADTDMTELFAKMYPQPMTLVDLASKEPHVFPYLCMAEVMKMNHQEVTGYFSVNSDVLLNPWSVRDIIFNQHPQSSPWLYRVWFQASLDKPETESPLNPTVTWPQWNDPINGRAALKVTLQDLDFISQSIIKHLIDVRLEKRLDEKVVRYLQRYNTIITTFLNKFRINGPLSNATVQYGSSEVFYVPYKYREDFIVLADQFHRFRVHADLAVPTILNGMVPYQQNVVPINGSIVMTLHTSHLVSTYKRNHVFLYPWQLFMSRAPDRRRFMCKTYLPYVDLSLLISQI